MSTISIKQLTIMTDQAIIDLWSVESERVRSAFLAMGKLTYAASLRMDSKKLRKWKSELSLSKGSSNRANITSRFIKLFVVTDKITEQRFDSITWQVIEAVKKLTPDWKKTPDEDTLDQHGAMISEELDNATLLRSLTALATKPTREIAATAKNNFPELGDPVTDDFLEQLHQSNLASYPLINGINDYVKNHESSLAAYGVKLTVMALLSDCDHETDFTCTSMQ